MSKPKANMLEAFRATGVDVPPSPAGPGAGVPGEASPGAPGRAWTAEGAGGPADPIAPMSESERWDPASLARDAAGAAPSARAIRLGSPAFVLAQLALVAAAFSLGYVTGGEVAAGAGDEGERASLPALDGRGTPAGPGRAAPLSRGALSREGSGAPGVGAGAEAARGDRLVLAFEDPANAFTVQAASYHDTERGRQLAAHWLGKLQEAGFPAVQRRVGGMLALFVGASPNGIEMEDLRERIRAVRDVSGDVVFPDPRVVSLADFR